MGIIKSNLTFGDSEDLNGNCIEGYAGAIVVVYMDEDFEPDECEACNVDDLSDMGGDYEFCAYRVELPCEPITIECGEPSAAPSGSFYPSSAPTEEPSESFEPSSPPTESPTASPTKTPTASPTDSPSSSPSDPIDPVITGPPVCPPSDPILIDIEGETMYPTPPVTITFQNGTHVEFKVENTFGTTISSVFTQYHSGSFGETECLEEENVEKDSQIEIEFTAQCMLHSKLSVINIWITDCSDHDGAAPFLDEGDDAEIPECCHPDERKCKTVEYIFKLPCVSPCPTEAPTTVPIEENAVEEEESATEAPTNVGGRRHLTAASSHKKIHEHNASLKKKTEQEGSAEEFESITGKPLKNDANDHFCVVEDYPCGPDNDKVYACHYSARDGYKTFCVPEEDSDALRFYPKDYCGPCVGGYVQ